MGQRGPWRKTSRSGFSLVELIVVTAVMSIVGLVFLSQFNYQAKSGRSLDLAANFRDTVNSLQLILSDSSSVCALAFQSNQFVPTLGTQSIKIMQPGSGTVFLQPQKTPDPSGLTVSALSLMPLPNTLSFPAPGTAHVLATLHLQVQKNSLNNVGGNNFQHDFLIGLDVSAANTITGCGAPAKVCTVYTEIHSNKGNNNAPSAPPYYFESTSNNGVFCCPSTDQTADNFTAPDEIVTINWQFLAIHSIGSFNVGQFNTAVTPSVSQPTCVQYNAVGNGHRVQLNCCQ